LELPSQTNAHWCRNLALVHLLTQVIFLADTSIVENIAFGVPVEQIDHTRLRQAAQKAQIA
jgi:ATP-binding cassette subfamily B protein